jgi:hypothetical protein
VGEPGPTGEIGVASQGIGFPSKSAGYW